MEMGSSSLTESGGSSSSSPPNSSSEPLNGLKFGQKIYFEDVGLGPPAKSGGGSSSKPGSGAAAQPRKAQPARCQVEGCGVDLSGAKGYYSRHKVCGTHSKTPTVVVAGLEQRFCQQCSRFHQLPEFDQGKRSCRRRLAGHNERRRKPQPGTLFSPRYGRLAPSVYENSSRAGSFVMDFSAYPRPGRDAWPTTRFPEQSPGNQNQVTATGKYLLQPSWHGNPEDPSPDIFLQGGSAAGECYTTGVSDSSRALSLLSNQQWGSENPMNTHGAPASHFPDASWGFKGNEAGSSGNGDSGLGQNQFSGELEQTQQGRGHYMAYDSTQQMHWSL